jgi:hypothetical protein
MIGTLVTAPIVSSTHPTLFRWPRFNLSASNNPSPAPNAARVPAMNPISGILNETFPLGINFSFLQFRTKNGIAAGILQMPLFALFRSSGQVGDLHHESEAMAVSVAR